MRVSTPVHAFLLTGLLHIGLAFLTDTRPIQLFWYPQALAATQGFLFGSLALYYLFFAALYWLAGRRVLAQWPTRVHFLLSLAYSLSLLLFPNSDRLFIPIPLITTVLFAGGLLLGSINVLGGGLRALLRDGDDGRAEPPGPMVE